MEEGSAPAAAMAAARAVWNRVDDEASTIPPEPTTTPRHEEIQTPRWWSLLESPVFGPLLLLAALWGFLSLIKVVDYHLYGDLIPRPAMTALGVKNAASVTERLPPELRARYRSLLSEHESRRRLVSWQRSRFPRSDHYSVSTYVWSRDLKRKNLTAEVVLAAIVDRLRTIESVEGTRRLPDIEAALEENRRSTMNSQRKPGESFRDYLEVPRTSPGAAR